MVSVYQVVSKPIQDSKYLRDNISVYFGNRVTNVSNNVTRDSNQSSGTKSNALFNATNLSVGSKSKDSVFSSQFCSMLKLIKFQSNLLLTLSSKLQR